MIVNEANASMIINENDNSMVEVESKEQPKSFLNKYISNLKSSENEIENQKDQIRKKIQDCDDACLKEL
jgi:Cu2+-containing amine oxidase